MYVSDLHLSVRTTNALLRAGFNTIEKLYSIIENEKIHAVRGLTEDGIKEIMKEIYCRNCKRSIYGEYKDCDVNIENYGNYPKGIHKCRCKVSINP